METANRTEPVHYRTAAVDGVNVFYREAGPDSGPVVLLLHGYPSSSRMFRDLLPQLSDAYRLVKGGWSRPRSLFDTRTDSNSN